MFIGGVSCTLLERVNISRGVEFRLVLGTARAEMAYVRSPFSFQISTSFVPFPYSPLLSLAFSFPGRNSLYPREALPLHYAHRGQSPPAAHCILSLITSLTPRLFVTVNDDDPPQHGTSLLPLLPLQPASYSTLTVFA